MKTLYYNGRVYTGALPLQEAFLVEEDHFTFAGTLEQAQHLPYDHKVDLKGGFVCAGFNDSHMHLLNFGQTLTIAPLAQHTGSLADMLNCLKQTAPGRGGWILGRGWNQDRFLDQNRMPTRWDLDQVSVTAPVCAVRACGHALVLNSLALDILGITADTPQPEGGQIGMENGTPNGLLFDNAMTLVYSKIPAPCKEEVKAMLRSACRQLNAHGITSCHSDDYCVFDALPWQTVNEAYQELEESGELTVRVYQQANFTDVPALAAFIAKSNVTGTGSPMFRIGPLKLLGDGALGARTAYLSRPYADDPTTRGLSVFTAEEFDALIGYAHSHNMQVAVHCIGDGCLDLVLQSYQKAQDVLPRADARHGIVHCQITRPDQLARITAQNLHVYAQSIFLDYDIHIVTQRAGEELAASSYSWKTLLKQGTTVSNGSDCPVENPDVLAGIQCAVTRSDLHGAATYLPQEAFTVQEALDSFTIAGAWASFEEDFKGRIRPGMAADFVVLGQNPYETAPTDLKTIPILQTFLNGKEVFHQ